MPARTFTAGVAIAALLVTTTPALAAQTYEEQVLSLTNGERAAAGCPALAPNAQLAAAAKKHNDEMARTGNLSHTGVDGSTPAQRITEAGYQYRVMAENIAAGQTSAEEVVRAWMNSEGHRANIVNCELRDLGVAYAVNRDNKPFWTQDFGATG
ncbi:CAP domain-containing protein [Saccharothrix deserti]|uniref:CAP domain-containing protein n=1 Tax=Saccharothrix deserti TaxID=2593674 RepID=UPI00131C5988|nr:CAP domain-containing protein [Saccharothrix deserti]